MSSDPPKVPILETNRLTLRPWVEEDAPNLLPAFGDAGALRFWNPPSTATAEELAAVIARSRGASPQLHAAWSLALSPAFCCRTTKLDASSVCPDRSGEGEKRLFGHSHQRPG